MKKIVFCLLSVALGLAVTSTLSAKPPAKNKQSRNSTTAQESGSRNTGPSALAESANGWTFVNGEWVHPEGYKFVNGKIMRTTAKTGRAVPKPPGKLALDNPQKLTPQSKAAATTRSSTPSISEAEKKAEEHQKNLQQRPASQTGTHL